MQAMLLAAGFGTRLKPLTNRRPKCLMPVMNRPLLDVWLSKLGGAKVERVVVNTHHLAGMVHQWLEGNPPAGLKISLSHEPEILGTGGGLVAARPLLGEEPFILANADVLAAQNPAELFARLKASGALAVLGVVDDPRFNTVALDQRGRVLGFSGEDAPRAPAAWRTYSGLAAIAPDFLRFLPQNGYSTLVDGLKAAIRAGGLVESFPLAGFWDDLGTPDRLLGLHRSLAFSPPAGLEELAPERPLAIHPAARVSPQAGLAGFVAAGSGAVIEAGARVRDAVLLPNSRVAAGAQVEEAILGDGFMAESSIKGGAYG